MFRMISQDSETCIADSCIGIFLRNPQRNGKAFRLSRIILILTEKRKELLPLSNCMFQIQDNTVYTFAQSCTIKAFR